MEKIKFITRFNYWEDWALDRNDSIGKEILRIPIENEEEIKKELKSLIKIYEETNDYSIIPKLISLQRSMALTYADDIGTIIWQARLEKKYMDILEEIVTAVKGEKRGRNNLNKLKKTIGEDIFEFKQMVNKKLKGENYESFTEYQDTNLTLIWKNYIKVSRLIIQSLNMNENDISDWEFIFNIFDFMKENIHIAQPSLFMKYGDSLELILYRSKGF